MEWSDAILPLATVLGTIITAFLTYKNARVGVKTVEKQQELEVMKFNSTAKVDAAEKLGNISVKLADSLGAQLKDCVSRRDELEEEVNLAAEKLLISKILVRKLLQDLLLKHERVADPNCKNSQLITQLINDILVEVEKGL
jgi:hypothetical protein